MLGWRVINSVQKCYSVSSPLGEGRGPSRELRASIAVTIGCPSLYKAKLKLAQKLILKGVSQSNNFLRFFAALNKCQYYASNL